MKERLPDFFVAGVPRSGTTSLHYLFSQSPLVSMPTLKEPKLFEVWGGKSENHHFAGPGDTAKIPRIVKSLAEYHSLFDKTKTFWGEASPTYFHSAAAMENIASNIPQAKIIIVLRNPVDRAYSHYMQNWNSGNEKLSFCDALLAGESRVLNQDWFWTWDIARQSLYGQAIRAWRGTFGEENVLFLQFEEILNADSSLFEKLSKFLGFKVPTPETTLLHMNQSGIARFKTIDILLRRLTGQKVAIRKSLPRPLVLPAQRLYHYVRSRNTSPARQLNATDQRFAVEIFAKDIDETASLLNWNLADWKMIK